MGEGALVLGLAMRPARGRFRPRDGRPRGPSSMGDIGSFAAGEAAAANAEVRANSPEAAVGSSDRSSIVDPRSSKIEDGRSKIEAAPYRSSRQEAPHA